MNLKHLDLSLPLLAEQAKKERRSVNSWLTILIEQKKYAQHDKTH